MSPVGAYRIRPTKRPDRGGCMTMRRRKIFQACGYIFGKTVFAPCGGTWWAYAIRPYPTGRKTPGTQLDLSTRTWHLSLLDLPIGNTILCLEPFSTRLLPCFDYFTIYDIGPSRLL